MTDPREISVAIVVGLACALAGCGSSGRGSSASTTASSPMVTATPTTTSAPGSSASGAPDRFVYVLDNGNSLVSVYSIDPSSGALTAKGAPLSVASGGAYSYGALAKAPAARLVFVESQTGVPGQPTSSSISELAADATTGALAPEGALSWGPGALPVAMAVNPKETFLVVSDPNLDEVYSCSIGASGSLALVSSASLAAGSSPGSLAIDPSGANVYVAHRTGALSVLALDGQGGLTPTSTAAVGGSFLGQVVVSPSGELVFVADGDQTVSAFARDSGTGALTAIGVATGPGPFPAGGSTALAIDPRGARLYAFMQEYISATSGGVSGVVALFGVDPSSGALTLEPPVLDTNAVAWVVLDSSGTFAFVPTDAACTTLGVFKVDAATGALVSKGSVTLNPGPLAPAPFLASVVTLP